MTPKGKIARLPHDIREQLNHRLQDGEPAQTILNWLNSLPQVQSILAEYFYSRPINEVNLSNWRIGGYHDWVLAQQALDFAAEFQTPASKDQDPDVRLDQSVTEKLAHWVALQYIATARPLLAAEEDPRQKWDLLRGLCHDVVRLRRSDLASERFRFKIETLQQETRLEQIKESAELKAQQIRGRMFDEFVLGSLRRQRAAKDPNASCSPSNSSPPTQPAPKPDSGPTQS